MRRTLAALLAVVTLAGTVLSAGAAPAAARPARHHDPDILALTPEIGRFLARRIRPGQPRRLRLQALLDVIFSEDGLRITYGNSRTRTARETFEERSGNCLSFTLMFVAMARHLGLRAYFREVDEVTSWDQRGDVVVTERHMFAEVEADNAIVQVDFLPSGAKSYRSTRRVGLARVYAHYYSNLGVERLTAGRAAGSIALFEKALEHDPEFSQALVNLGVAYRRTGQPELAERTLLRALEIDRGALAAVSNLSSLYLAQGRREEAAPLLDRVAGHLRRNPFHHFRQGMLASRNERWDAAIEHVREAIRRRPQEALFHVEMAQLQLRVGRPSQARSSLERARRLAESELERQRIRELIDELDAAG